LLQVVKNFYAVNFGGILKPMGIISGEPGWRVAQRRAPADPAQAAALQR
jgi:hypothetical protein